MRDSDMNILNVVIDAGDGAILSSSSFSWQNMMMHDGMMGIRGPMMGFR